MHLNELIPTIHLQLQSRISVVYLECVLKVGDSDQISVFLADDMLTRAINKRLAGLRNRRS